jgi:hypothetical protein
MRRVLEGEMELHCAGVMGVSGRCEIRSRVR